MSYAIGIDLGGTNIKAVAVRENGEMLERLTSSTEDNALAAWAGHVAEQIKELEARQGEAATWVGLASPGIAAADERSISSVGGHLERIRGLDWTERLKTARTVRVLNDAHAALLGEVWQGAAVGRREAVLLTLGTGVGGAILTDGRVLKGHIGRGGHLGHICLDTDAAPDCIGIPGSLEDAIGNRTLPARSGGLFTSTEQLVSAHLAGDAEAGRVWLRSVYQLACAVASIINIVDPEVVIIGGGIARAGRALFEPLGEYLERLEWRPDGHPVSILPALLGDFAGALGAACNAIRADDGSAPRN